MSCSEPAKEWPFSLARHRNSKTHSYSLRTSRLAIATIKSSTGPRFCTPQAHARTGCMIPYDKKRRLQRKIVGQVPKTAGFKTDSAKPKTPSQSLPTQLWKSHLAKVVWLQAPTKRRQQRDTCITWAFSAPPHTIHL